MNVETALRLDPKTGQESKIAVLAHDIDRAEP